MCDKCVRYKNKGCKYDIKPNFTTHVPIPPRSKFHQQAQDIRENILNMPIGSSWLLDSEFEKCHLLPVRNFVHYQLKELEIQGKLMTSDFTMRTLELPNGLWELRMWHLKEEPS